MKILSINYGSSSLKFKLINMPAEEILMEGQFKHYNSLNIVLDIKEKIAQEKKTFSLSINEWNERINKLISVLIKHKTINSVEEIDFIVHRVVHGGEKYIKPTMVSKYIIKDLEKNYNELAPLHNPYQIQAIKDISKINMNLKQIIIFDTSFNLTIPEENYIYGIPYKYSKKYKIRKYGFHGISHQYISKETKKLLNNNSIRVISCHLGSGCSVCAIKNCISIDNSFGFSPSSGLITSTRVGNIDYNAVQYLKNKLKVSDSQIQQILSTKSGLKGISEYTEDMKILLENLNDYKSSLAIKKFIYDITNTIASFISEMNGIDALIFTGGIGQGSPYVRKAIVDKLKIFSINISQELNQKSIDVSNIINISADSQVIQTFIIPANEELEMARQVYQEFNLKL